MSEHLKIANELLESDWLKTRSIQRRADASLEEIPGIPEDVFVNEVLNARYQLGVTWPNWPQVIAVRCAKERDVE